jgi:hypothetical protein
MVIPALRAAYNDYLSKRGAPSTVVPVGFEPAIKLSLLGLYKSSAKKYKLNWIRDLRSSASYPYCPMCGHPGRQDIEHYLPESHFPEFAFFSFNLIPSCTTCNRKRGRYANQPGQALGLLHPYFDGPILSTPLLSVKIEGTTLANGTVTYAAPSFLPIALLPPGNALHPRLANHLDRCIQTDDFTRWVTGRWVVWRQKAHTYSLVDLPGEITKELNAEVDAGGINNWTAAFLRGLSADVSVMNWIHQNPLLI